MACGHLFETFCVTQLKRMGSIELHSFGSLKSADKGCDLRGFFINDRRKQPLIGQCKFRKDATLSKNGEIKPFSLAEVRDFEAVLNREREIVEINSNNDNNSYKPIGIICSNSRLSKVAKKRILNQLVLPIIFFKFDCDENVLSVEEDDCDPQSLHSASLLTQFEINNVAKDILKQNCGLSFQSAIQLVPSNNGSNNFIKNLVLKKENMYN